MDQSKRNVRHLFDMMLLMKKKERLFRQKWSCEYDEIDCEDVFSFIEILGKGNFGTVSLERHKMENKLYAIKKWEIPDLDVLRMIAIQDEIKIMHCIDFNFVLSSEYYFLDNQYIYMVMPYVVGGDLYGLLHEKKKFGDNLTKFYAAQVVLGLEYLHSVGLIYRDVKLQNILLESDGYIKLTDFGFCRRLSKLERAQTPRGTLEYVAPEIIRRESYNHAVDWWSLGVAIFHMLAGKTPFGAPNTHLTIMYISKRRLVFPLDFSPLSKKILFGFLEVNVNERLGNTKGGVSAIKNHDWFRTIDWNSVLHKTMKPTYKPKLNIAANGSNPELKSDKSSLELMNVSAFSSSPDS